MPLGFLVVLSEPGEQVALDEFQDWYNNEHVPLRLNHLPSFLTGARFSAIDSVKPSWLALYDVDDTSSFQHESYTRLRANRSPREASLVQRLEVLDRRTCEFISDSGESGLTTSLQSANPTKFIVTHGVKLSPFSGSDPEQLFKKWAEDAYQSLKGIEGWVRTRSYRCIDSLRTGTSVGKGPEEQNVPKYLVVHELMSYSVAELAAFKAVTDQADSGVEIIEDRRWELYRAYPGIAQGNVTQHE